MCVKWGIEKSGFAINRGITRAKKKHRCFAVLLLRLGSNKHGFDTPNRLSQIYLRHGAAAAQNPICMPQKQPHKST